MSQVKYPPVGFHFRVTFTGKGGLHAETSYQEVTGLSVEIPTEDIVEGGELRFVHKLPTTPKYPNLVLKRGLLVNSALRTWIEKAINEFTFSPVLVTVALLNNNGDAQMSWVIHNARPVKWEVSSFDSTNNSVVIESLELAYDYFKTKT